MKLDKAYVRKRLQAMNQAKTREERRFKLIKELYEIYEAHLDMGEQWNKPYRFGELFGSLQRKYADIIDNLPEVKLRSTRTKNQNFVIALQSSLDSVERQTNAVREKCRSLWDSVMYGTGILFEGYASVEKEITPVEDSLYLKGGNKKKVPIYSGLSSERVDPRDFYIDETCTVFYDETGMMGARDCARVRIYPYDDFKEYLKDIPGIKNLDKIPAASYGVNFFGLERPISTSESLQKSQSQYAIVTEYWNQVHDFMGLYVNGEEVYTGANPFKHKRLPFVLYYNYRRDDSVWGISEAEVLAPFIFAKEEIMNLMILDAKLALQPAIAVSGDVMFNSEEAELQPGAIFTLRGLNGGSVKDAITPLRFGGIPPEATALMTRIEDSQIIVTGDDIRSLYQQPSQLATQTLSKREVAQKRLRSNIYQNTIESEKYRAQMRLSNIIQFYSLPYQNIDGRVVFRRIRIDGYNVVQAGDESMPEFIQSYGAQNYFTLSKVITENASTDEIELEVVDAKNDESLRKDEVDNMLMYLKYTVELSQFDPTLLQKMDMGANLRQLAQKMNMDTDELFPTAAVDTAQDSVDIELELIRMGQLPPINQDQDPFKSLERYTKFMKSDDYEELSNPARNALSQLINLTLDYVPSYLLKKLEEKRASNRPRSVPVNGQEAMGSPGGIPQRSGGPGVPQLPQGAVQPGGQPSPIINTPPVQAPPGVAKRTGFRAAESSGNDLQST